MMRMISIRESGGHISITEKAIGVVDRATYILGKKHRVSI